jgi:hypothetical protein
MSEDTSFATSAWADAEEEAQAGGGDFIALEDKESVVGVFCGVPYVRKIVWINGKSEPYDQDVHVDKPKRRVGINFYDVQTKTMRIFEGSPTWFRQVASLHKKYKGLDSKVFEITRSGSGTDTTYMIAYERDIDAELASALDACELHDLHTSIGSGGWAGLTDWRGNPVEGMVFGGGGAVLDEALAKIQEAKNKTELQAVMDTYRPRVNEDSKARLATAANLRMSVLMEETKRQTAKVRDFFAA